MAARHMKKKASGGIATQMADDSPESDVFKEAEGKKKGGKAVGKMHGSKSRLRLDKPGRKMGGRVGADTSPLSSANRTSSPDAAPRSQGGN